MIADPSTFGLVESQGPPVPPVPPTPCRDQVVDSNKQIERRININHDKTISVAIGIYRKEREQHPDVPIEISPTRQGADGLWDRFRVDRIESPDLLAEPQRV